MKMVNLVTLVIAVLALASTQPAHSGVVTCDELFRAESSINAETAVSWSVREASPDDLEPILKIQKSRSRAVVGSDETRGFLSEPFSEQELRNLIKNPEVQFYVFETEGAVLGFSVGYPLKPAEEIPPIHEFDFVNDKFRNILLNQPVYYGREIAVATDASAIVGLELFRAHIRYAEQNGLEWGMNMVSLDPPNRRSIRLHNYFGMKNVGRATDHRNGQVFGLFFRPVQLERWSEFEDVL